MDSSTLQPTPTDTNNTKDPLQGGSLRAELRDPMTNVFQFMPNPNYLRRTCTTLLEWFVWCLEVVPSEEQLSLWNFASTAQGYSLAELVPVSASVFPRSSCWSQAGVRLVISTLPPSLTTLSKLLPDGGQPIRPVSVTLMSLPSIQTTGPAFLGNCTSVAHLALRDLPALETINRNFAENCVALKLVTLDDLPALTRLESDFLAGCVRLRVITLQNLPVLDHILHRFAAGCSSVHRVTLSDLPKLTSIENSFGLECGSVQHLTLEKLPKLCKIDEFFAAGMESLPKMSFKNLPELVSVEFGINPNVLATFGSLVELEVDNVPKLNAATKGKLDNMQQKLRKRNAKKKSKEQKLEASEQGGKDGQCGCCGHEK